MGAVRPPRLLASCPWWFVVVEGALIAGAFTSAMIVAHCDDSTLRRPADSPMIATPDAFEFDL